MQLINLAFSALGASFISYASSIFAIVMVLGFFAFVVKSLVS